MFGDAVLAIKRYKARQTGIIQPEGEEVEIGTPDDEVDTFDALAE